MLELIVPVSSARDAKAWKFESIRFSVSVGTMKETFRLYSVRAIHDWNGASFDDTGILSAVSTYPVKWCFTSKLIDYNDTSLMVRKFDELSNLFHAVVYWIDNIDCLKAVPVGSGVMVRNVDSIDIARLKDYQVWIGGHTTYRKQWLLFCEYVTRGVIPVGVLLPESNSKKFYGNVVKRDLGVERTRRSAEWAQETSVQNIVSYWEIVQSQMDRISKASVVRAVDDYALSGPSSEKHQEETV